MSLTLNTGRQAGINSAGHSVSYILHLPDDCIFMHMGELQNIHWWRAHYALFNSKGNKNLGRYFGALWIFMSLLWSQKIFVESWEDNLLADSSIAMYLLIVGWWKVIAIISHLKQSATFKDSHYLQIITEAVMSKSIFMIMNKWYVSLSLSGMTSTSFSCKQRCEPGCENKSALECN